MEKKQKYICVYCGSSMGNGNLYADAARETGRMIARIGCGLLYGGACCGTMGKVADAALESGADVCGIIPDFFKDYEFEVLHTGISRLIRVKTMAERKAMLIEQADAFVALPGSYGTLDELFETLVLVQLKQIEKPVFLLNLNVFQQPRAEAELVRILPRRGKGRLKTNVFQQPRAEGELAQAMPIPDKDRSKTKGFYDPLLALFDQMQAAGFLQAENRRLLQVVNTVEELETRLLKLI